MTFRHWQIQSRLEQGLAGSPAGPRWGPTLGGGCWVVVPAAANPGPGGVMLAMCFRNSTGCATGPRMTESRTRSQSVSIDLGRRLGWGSAGERGGGTVGVGSGLGPMAVPICPWGWPGDPRDSPSSSPRQGKGRYFLKKEYG